MEEQRPAVYPAGLVLCISMKPCCAMNAFAVQDVAFIVEEVKAQEQGVHRPVDCHASPAVHGG